MLSEESICFTKMTTAEKTAMSREGRGMGGLEDDMFFCIDERFLFLSMTSPEEEYEEISFFWEGLYDDVSKYFPSFPSMRQRFSSSHCERCIEQEYSLMCPTSEISIFWYWLSLTRAYFLKYISEGRRNLCSFLDGKSETMSLSWTMVRILSQNDNPYFLKRGFFERCK